MGSCGTIRQKNEVYIRALVQFHNRALGSLEVSRIINCPAGEIAFGGNGTQGEINWDFERMNEMNVYLSGANGAQNESVRSSDG